MAVLDSDKLRIYNRALFHLGSRKLASLTENREPRRVLDEIWGPTNEAVKFALAKSGWNFAMRAVKWTDDDLVEAEFGWNCVYAKPSDYARLEAISTDPRFRITLTGDDYAVENGYILTDHSTVYVKYVSTGDSFGMDSSLWTEAFIEYLGYYLAYHGAPRINGSFTEKEYLRERMDEYLGNARSTDTMEQGTRRLQPGNWAQARGGRYARGNINKLTGE